MCTQLKNKWLDGDWVEEGDQGEGGGEGQWAVLGTKTEEIMSCAFMNISQWIPKLCKLSCTHKNIN